jgi:hypothetical protein
MTTIEKCFRVWFCWYIGYARCVVRGFVVMIERKSQKEESCYVIGMIYSAQMHVIGDDILKFIWRA